jgi:prophage DNA circulation protein
MGKRSANFRVTAYCIGPNYLDERDRLRRALDQEGAGQLTLPVMQSMQVVCESYTVAEQRERGGFCTFEMHFMEAGVAGFSQVAQDTNSLAKGAASTSDAAAAATLNSKLAAAP